VNPSLSHLVTRFFVSYLANERGASQNTIAAYSDSLRLLIKHLCEKHNKQPEELGMEMLDPEAILDFLDHLEHDRNNGRSTRNQRLAAIKSFLHFAARENPESMLQNERIQAIRAKKTDHKPPPSLSVEQVRVILECIDTPPSSGFATKPSSSCSTTPERECRKSPTCARATCASTVPQPPPSPERDAKPAPFHSGRKPCSSSKPTCRQGNTPASTPNTSSSTTRANPSPASESGDE